jgi:hypothetical protein
MITQIALRLVCGMSLTWCIMPRAVVTAGFFRIQMLVSLGLSVLAAVTIGDEAAAPAERWLSAGPLRVLCLLLAASSFTGSVLWTLVRRSAGTAVCVLVAVLAAATLLAATVPFQSARPTALLLMATSELSSAWLFGGAVTAMLLGHWYLTATGMALDPLIRLTQLLLVAAVLRGLLAGVALATLPSTSPHDVMAGGVHGIWLILRWTAGILGPLLLGLMVRRILRYRNTQSATGVLFAAVILVFIGETTAALLFRDFHWPL